MCGATAITTVAQDNADDQQSEPEPLEFDDEGVGVTDEFEIEGEPTVIESTHDGESLRRLLRTHQRFQRIRINQNDKIRPSEK